MVAIGHQAEAKRGEFWWDFFGAVDLENTEKKLTFVDSIAS